MKKQSHFETCIAIFCGRRRSSSSSSSSKEYSAASVAAAARKRRARRGSRERRRWLYPWVYIPLSAALYTRARRDYRARSLAVDNSARISVAAFARSRRPVTKTNLWCALPERSVPHTIIIIPACALTEDGGRKRERTSATTRSPLSLSLSLSLLWL